MKRWFSLLLIGLSSFGWCQAEWQKASTASLPPSQEVVEERNLLDHALNLARGHQDFKTLHFKQHEKEFVRLVQEGQSPKTLFIGCSDSRILPDLILGTRPGDLFVIRTAGNFVPPYNEKNCDGVSASIQYALEVLNVKHIIVCGHSHCGAIQGLFKEIDPTSLGIIKCWLQFGEEAKKMTLEVAKPDLPKEELYSLAEQLSVIYQLEHLMTFPFVKKRLETGQLELHGWYYKIETGEIFYYDPEIYRFKSLSDFLKKRQGAPALTQ